jgi:hypothetical protein
MRKGGLLTAVNMVTLTEKISGGTGECGRERKRPMKIRQRQKKKDEKKNNRRNARTRSISIMHVYIKAVAA